MDELKIDCGESIGSFVVGEYSNSNSSQNTSFEELPSCCVNCDICQNLKEDFNGLTNAEQWEKDWCDSYWYQQVLKELATGNYSKEEMVVIAKYVSTSYSFPQVEEIRDPEQKFLRREIAFCLKKEKK